MRHFCTILFCNEPKIPQKMFKNFANALIKWNRKGEVF